MQLRRMCTFFTSLLSLPPLAHPSPLGYHRAPGWALLYSNFSPAIEVSLFIFFLRHKWQEDLLDVNRNRKRIGDSS